jgi:hypothetical protein
MNLKLAFNDIKHLVFVLMPVRRRFVFGLRHILQYAETSTCVFVLDEKGHIYSEYVESGIGRAPAFKCN